MPTPGRTRPLIQGIAHAAGVSVAQLGHKVQVQVAAGLQPTMKDRVQERRHVVSGLAVLAAEGPSEAIKAAYTVKGLKLREISAPGSLFPPKVRSIAGQFVMEGLYGLSPDCRPFLDVWTELKIQQVADMTEEATNKLNDDLEADNLSISICLDPPFAQVSWFEPDGTMPSVQWFPADHKPPAPGQRRTVHKITYVPSGVLIAAAKVWRETQDLVRASKPSAAKRNAAAQNENAAALAGATAAPSDQSKSDQPTHDQPRRADQDALHTQHPNGDRAKSQSQSDPAVTLAQHVCRIKSDEERSPPGRAKGRPHRSTA